MTLRASGMHLKPHWKLQKGEHPLETRRELLETLMSPAKASQEAPRRAACRKPAFPWHTPASTSARQPLGILPPNVLCRMSGQSPLENGLDVKTKKNAPSTTIHQGEPADGPLDIWAVVRPGNTKEKIAFFAAHQCSNRIGSMKIKSSWDIDGRATKRRKKSGELKKAKSQLERMQDVSGRSCPPEPCACSAELCTLQAGSDGGEGGQAGRPLSVIQMVALLEQRASALLASCAKTSTSSSAIARPNGQPRTGALSSEPCGAQGAREEPAGRGSPEIGEPPSEPVRVLDMVARLESECLKQQSQREAGSLSRNNSFRRHVGRVLLATGAQAEDTKTCRGIPEAPSTRLSPARSLSVDRCSPAGERAWDGGPRGCPPLPMGGNFHPSCPGLEPGQPSTVKNSDRYDVEMTEELVRPPCPPHTCPQAAEPAQGAGERGSRELEPLGGQSPKPRSKESVCIRITVAKVEADQPSPLAACEDPLPGMLFFLPPAQHQAPCVPPNKSTMQEPSAATEPDTPAEGHADLDPEGQSTATEPGASLASPAEPPLPVLEASACKKQVSHDFLETRFKIQQLLEPQQYMAFLPHHIMVKIFRLLPTKSLVALKCTCCYFKFIIEYYNIRPADSRWVRDPRYREDPCKQCKKKYVKGDVSLCRWHPKPYCQALPYGPGYWMCCHRSQKAFPGCKLGLHDNHWVPACHSFNRAIHKKAKGTDTEEDY
ncbi:F-box only protein 34 isoform X1 [Ochotona curzoniae]|uniref:F-box only protein 34 isoform X1 n=2 Tax=Ochotona curzoniae TaxID=130825 RepID=UPI001B352513|nr:F-box only protein 34 isoform X1 [Ochotona curzoniae]